MTKVFLDGEIIDEIEEPGDIQESLIEKRRSGDIDKEVGVYYAEDKDEIRINTDAGRVQRPVIAVVDGEPQMTDEQREKLEEGEISLQDLEEEGAIDYLDAEEEENAYVAMDEDEEAPIFDDPLDDLKPGDPRPGDTPLEEGTEEPTDDDDTVLGDEEIPDDPGSEKITPDEPIGDGDLPSDSSSLILVGIPPEAVI